MDQFEGHPNADDILGRRALAHTRPRGANLIRAMAMLEMYRLLPGRSLGGCVHIVVDDPNPEQHHADWCVANAEGWAGDYGNALGESDMGGSVDVLMAQAVAALTDAERVRLQREG